MAPLRIRGKMDHLVTSRSFLFLPLAHCQEQASVFCCRAVRSSCGSCMNEMSSNPLRYRCGRRVRSVLIGATRCSLVCENTVLLATQGPCGSVRRCRGDTVTHDTNVQVNNVTPVTLGVTFGGSKINADRKEVALQKKRVEVRGTQRTCGEREHLFHQSVRILQPFLLSLSLFDALHFLSLTLMARLSSVGRTQVQC